MHILKMKREILWEYCSWASYNAKWRDKTSMFKMFYFEHRSKVSIDCTNQLVKSMVTCSQTSLLKQFSQIVVAICLI